MEPYQGRYTRGVLMLQTQNFTNGAPLSHGVFSWAFSPDDFCFLCEWWKWRMLPNLKIVHPGRLTWNLSCYTEKEKDLPNHHGFSFYVNLRGWIFRISFPKANTSSLYRQGLKAVPRRLGWVQPCSVEKSL